MLLNITDVIGNDGFDLKVDAKLENFNFSFAGEEYSFSAPPHILGKIKNSGGTVEFDVTVSGTVNTRCSRCLSPVEFNFSIPVLEAVEAQSDGSISQTIDLKEFAEQIISGEIPGSILCKEDCKGLCPICGTNLNTGKCDCKEDNHDPRFDILKQIKF